MLTEQEKVSGRKFRDAAQQRLEAQVVADNPYYVVPPYLAYYRHVCPAVGKSISLGLAEMYVLSPQDGEVPEGRLAFVYRRGHCAKCRRVAMSKVGRIVDAYERPPVGRTITWQD